MTTAATRAVIAQPRPSAESVKDGNVTTAAIASTTPTAPQTTPAWVSRRWGAIRAAIAGCSVDPYAAICSARYSASCMSLPY